MSPTRRDFLKTATTAALATAVSDPFANAGPVAGSDAIRIGVIGCGGRGTGAVEDALTSSQGVTLVAMGDLFADRVTPARARLKEKFGAAIDVPDDRVFTGFDAYKQVLSLIHI